MTHRIRALKLAPVTVKAAKHRWELVMAIGELQKMVQESSEKSRRDNTQPLDYQQSPLVTVD